MESCIKMDHEWPFYPGALQAECFRRFAPLGYTALADGYRLGYIDMTTLRRLFATPDIATSEPSDLLGIFLKTFETFDRKRDIGEELNRLSAEDTLVRPPLWMLLARIIVEKINDPSKALQTLQYVYDDVGNPTEMKPFTLYGGPPPPGLDPGGQTIAALKDFLDEHGVT